MIDYNIIATGSKGNAVVIDRKILIDCGVSFKALSKVYWALKLVLLTHIHSDHFQPTTLRLLAENRPTLRFACCAWLCKPLVDAGVPVSQIDVLEPGHMYGYGICNVRPDMVKHNVPNCAWKVWLPSGKLFYCTDMNNLNGITAPNYDLYMVEANYDDAEIQAKIAEKKLNGEYIYELGVLHNHMSIHVGILGDAGSDILMIAGVHEYGATISAKNVKHLAIPLNMEAKNAGSPRKFNDLRFIPVSPGYGFLVRDRKHPQKAPGRKKQEKHDAKKHPSGGEEDPRPNEDYEWMYMLVDSVTIPERSFIRASFDTGKATLENICKEAVDGIILKKWTAQEAADYIGKWAVEMTHDYFNTKLSPPKSATTQLTSTQYQPLFDTGRLYNSISYSVEGI